MQVTERILSNFEVLNPFHHIMALILRQQLWLLINLPPKLWDTNVYLFDRHLNYLPIWAETIAFHLDDSLEYYVANYQMVLRDAKMIGDW